MKVLGIETSCDETSLAVLDAREGEMHLEKYIVSSQIATHREYGGVVPEIAARMHCEVLLPLLQKTIGKKPLSAVDLIAVTAGPGLITSLMVGVQAAKTLSYALRKPLVGVNHLEGHMYSAWLGNSELVRDTERSFPALVLIVSGGHTELVLMRGHGSYTLLGQTADDAAGEAFDKVAKLLDRGYPGGPVISKLAQHGNPAAIDFPRPMLATTGYDMSFSGLKTAVRYYLEKKRRIPREELPDIAASFQQAVVDVLTAKTVRAIDEFGPRSLMLVGGVSANNALREALTHIGSERQLRVWLPALEHTGDNAGMIAVAGYYHRDEASLKLWRTLRFDPHLAFII
ncbi:MAG: tRNA (adenosine(37)-N6)-threonylcarbamoyltransferase complex transferase subunit TsaD [Candidatus Komeilibacteria bacterium]|nr:tRNA (adenosine(37)-N6)-threonylcarbamoyltransferase complex transferase subunit TsaD [Candidatus Komeilibacteria bacterium]